jgi:hypothetical protein
MELEKSTKWVLPGTEEGGGRRWKWGQGREMIYTMYAHVNK